MVVYQEMLRHSDGSLGSIESLELDWEYPIYPSSEVLE